jgi:DNA-binding protein HU-beta
MGRKPIGRDTDWPGPRKSETITLKKLARSLSEGRELSHKQAEAVLGDLVGLVTLHLKNGDRIRLGDLGTLLVRQRAARIGRNPATGKKISIKASKKVSFRAGRMLREEI